MSVNRRIGQVLPFFNKGLANILQETIDKLAGWWGNSSNTSCGEPTDRIGQDSSVDRTLFKGRAYQGDLTNEVTYKANIWDGIGTGDLTISAWVKIDAITNTYCMIAGDGVLAGSVSGAGLYVVQSTGYAVFQIRDTTGNATVTGTTNIVDGEWHHILGTRTSGTAAVYVDGVREHFIGSVNDVSELSTMNFRALANHTQNYYSEAAIRDLRVWNVGITQIEMNAGIYDDFIKGSIVKLDDMLLWDFCESTDLNNSFDSSGNGSHGTKNSFITSNHIEGQWQSMLNKYGYSSDGTYGEVPADVSDPTKDVFGNDLQFKGQAKYNLEVIQSACFVGDGVAYADFGAGTFDLIGTGDFLISLMIKGDIGTATEIFLSYGNSSNGFYAYSVASNGRLYFRIYGTIVNSVVICLDGEWHHVVFRRVGTDVRVYTDGVRRGGATDSNNVTLNDLIVGASSTITFNALHSICNVRTYNGTFTDEEIAEMAANQCVELGTEKSHLPLCEVSGDIYHDVSGNGNHGTIVSGDELNFGVQDEYHYLQQKGFLGVMNFVNENDDYIQFASTVCSNLTQWSVAIRFDKYERNILDFIIGGDSVKNIALCGAIQRLQFRDNTSAYLTWDGTGNTVNVSSVSVENRYVTLVMYADGTNIHAIVDGVYKGYITPNTTQLFINKLIRGYSSSANGTTGIFWDFRFWDSNIGQVECLKYHDDVMTVNPTNNLSMAHPITESTLQPDFGSITASLQGNPEQWIFPALSDKSTAVNGATLSHQQLGNLMLQYQTFQMPADIIELISADARAVLAESHLVNGSFDSDSSWTKGAGWTISGGKARASSVSGSTFFQVSKVEAGKSYVAIFEISEYVSGGLRLRWGSGTEYADFTASNNIFEIPITVVNTGYFGFYGTSNTSLAIDFVELREVTQQYGNNMMLNSGVRNAAGLVVNGDWIDSSSNGLADSMINHFANGIPSIAQGNGFNGNAQRFEVDAGAVGSICGIRQADLIVLGVTYNVSLKYRSDVSFQIWESLTGSVSTVGSSSGVVANHSFTFTASVTGSLFPIYLLSADAVLGVYIEIDEFSIQRVIDTLFYEPEVLGADPVPFAINSIPEWSYGHHYSNKDDGGKTMKDLILIEE